MTDRLIIADASKVSGADFLRAVMGKPPLSAAERAEKQRQADEFWAKRREESRRELEALRDRICAQASPALAAKFRAKWAEEDAVDQRREA